MDKTLPDDQLLTVTQAAKYLGIAESSLYKMLTRGLVPAYRVGARKRGIRFSLSELREALRQPSSVSEGNNEGR